MLLLCDGFRLKSLSAELGSCLNELFNNATIDFINLYQVCEVL